MEEKKKTIVVDEYYDWKIQAKTPITEKRMNDIAKELYEWARDCSTAYKVSQFFTTKGIGSTTWEGWVDKFEVIREAHKEAVRMIGDRREIGAIEKRLEPGMIASSMAHYDKAWKRLAEWRASLRNDKNEENQQKIVVMEVYNKKSPEEVAMEARRKMNGIARKRKHEKTGKITE